MKFATNKVGFDFLIGSSESKMKLQALILGLFLIPMACSEESGANLGNRNVICNEDGCRQVNPEVADTNLDQLVNNAAEEIDKAVPQITSGQSCTCTDRRNGRQYYQFQAITITYGFIVCSGIVGNVSCKCKCDNLVYNYPQQTPANFFGSVPNPFLNPFFYNYNYYNQYWGNFYRPNMQGTPRIFGRTKRDTRYGFQRPVKPIVFPRSVFSFGLQVQFGGSNFSQQFFPGSHAFNFGGSNFSQQFFSGSHAFNFGRKKRGIQGKPRGAESAEPQFHQNFNARPLIASYNCGPQGCNYSVSNQYFGGHHTNLERNINQENFGTYATNFGRKKRSADPQFFQRFDAGSVSNSYDCGHGGCNITGVAQHFGGQHSNLGSNFNQQYFGSSATNIGRKKRDATKRKRRSPQFFQSFSPGSQSTTNFCPFFGQCKIGPADISPAQAPLVPSLPQNSLGRTSMAAKGENLGSVGGTVCYCPYIVETYLRGTYHCSIHPSGKRICRCECQRPQNPPGVSMLSSNSSNPTRARTSEELQPSVHEKKKRQADQDTGNDDSSAANAKCGPRGCVGEQKGILSGSNRYRNYSRINRVVKNLLDFFGLQCNRNHDGDHSDNEEKILESEDKAKFDQNYNAESQAINVNCGLIGCLGDIVGVEPSVIEKIFRGVLGRPPPGYGHGKIPHYHYHPSGNRGTYNNGGIIPGHAPEGYGHSHPPPITDQF